MPRRKALVVDGYNVIRNNERYRRSGVDYDDAAWNEAREAVINDAAFLASEAYERCIVVFDGAGNAFSRGVPVRKAGVDVIFSPAGVSADSVIEQLAHDLREKGFEVVVVSSDFAVQSTVFGGGVVRMSAAGFGSISDGLEDEWRSTTTRTGFKTTLGERIDPAVAKRLSSWVRGEGEL